MKPLHILAAVPLLALSLAFAAPALAQPVAGDQAAPAAPATAVPTVAERAPRAVSGRELLTREERSSFRREFRQATPEQRAALRIRMRALLEQRAMERGVVLAEPGAGRGGNGREGGRDGRDGGAKVARLATARPPVAP